MKSQVVLGICLIIIGFLLSLTVIGAFYGVPLIVLGAFLIGYRNEEDKIETIREVKKK